MPTLNGAAVGIAAVGAAFLTEALIFGVRLVYCYRDPGPLFPRERSVA
jgi:hypothetical protein